MKTKPLGWFFAVVLSAMTLPAQTNDGTSPPTVPSAPPNPPAYSPGYAPPSIPPDGEFGGSGTSLVGAISLPYAFNWNAVGISGELGGLFMGQNFIGGEVSYYGSDERRYNVYNSGGYAGSFHSEQEVTTVDFAYRYFAPLTGFGAPVLFYVGGSAGVGFVNYSNDGSFFGFHNDNNGTFSGDALAGFQFNASPVFGVRLGYRYIYVSDAWRFDQRTNLGSSALDVSFAFRF